MVLREIPRADDRWFLCWKKGGDILLVHSHTEDNEAIDCPKCRAPMLFMGQHVACYACGMTFSAAKGAVSVFFGKHAWPDLSCNRYIVYDPGRDREWYEALKPKDIGSLEEASL